MLRRDSGGRARSPEQAVSPTRQGRGQPLYRLDTDAIRDLDILGCPAEVIPLDPSSLDEVLDGVPQVGKAAGAEQRAEEVVAGLRERLAGVQAVVGGLERLWRFALEWGDPPSNGGHSIREMLKVAGMAIAYSLAAAYSETSTAVSGWRGCGNIGPYGGLPAGKPSRVWGWTGLGTADGAGPAGSTPSSGCWP